jgi:hypothetical protein
MQSSVPFVRVSSRSQLFFLNYLLASPCLSLCLHITTSEWLFIVYNTEFCKYLWTNGKLGFKVGQQ